MTDFFHWKSSAVTRTINFDWNENNSVDQNKRTAVWWRSVQSTSAIGRVIFMFEVWTKVWPVF